MNRRKICVVTTSRAEFGLLRGLLTCIQEDSALRLQVIASGMHLAPKFGLTVREIEAAGVKVDHKIDMQLTGESGAANAKSIGLGLAGFADALTKLKPAIVVLLGDRFELLAPAVAALMLRIPVAHIHGGERTEGAIDESVRHAITKMASLHFPATDSYRRRIIQMGESPACVFNFGAPGLDQIHSTPLLTRAQLEHELGLPCKIQLPSSRTIPPRWIVKASTHRSVTSPQPSKQASSMPCSPWPMRTQKVSASTPGYARCALKILKNISGSPTSGIAATSVV